MNLGGHAGCFAEHIGSKMGVKSAPHTGATGFIKNQLGKFIALGFHNVGGFEQDFAACARTHFRPFRESGGSGIGSLTCVGGIGSRGNGCGFAGDRIFAFKGAVVRAGNGVVVDQQLDFIHDVFS